MSKRKTTTPQKMSTSKPLSGGLEQALRDLGPSNAERNFRAKQYIPTLTQTIVEVPELVDEFSEDEIADEPTLFKSSMKFGYQHGGRIARTCLDLIEDICKLIEMNLRSTNGFMKFINNTNKDSEVLITVEKKRIVIGESFHKPFFHWDNNSHYYFKKNLFRPNLNSSVISVFFGRGIKTEFSTIVGKELFKKLTSFLGLPTLPATDDPWETINEYKSGINDAMQDIKIEDFLAFLENNSKIAKSWICTQEAKHGHAVHYFPATLIRGIPSDVEGWGVEVKLEFGENKQAHNLLL